jgi:hypothetical protein
MCQKQGEQAEKIRLESSLISFSAEHQYTMNCGADTISQFGPLEQALYFSTSHAMNCGAGVINRASTTSSVFLSSAQFYRARGQFIAFDVLETENAVGARLIAPAVRFIAHGDLSRGWDHVHTTFCQPDWHSSPLKKSLFMDCGEPEALEDSSERRRFHPGW